MLPNHHGQTDRSSKREIKFENQGFKNNWSKRWKAVLNQTTLPSTGSPSDGLGDATVSESSVAPLPFPDGNNAADCDESDWVVDQVVVSGENPHKVEDPDANAGTRRSETSSVHHFPNDVEYDLDHGGLIAWMRWRVFPAVHKFFRPQFEDPDRELEFQKQAWYQSKSLAFYSSLYLVLNWVLYLILNLPSTKHSLYAEIIYYGGLTFLTLPVPFMITFNLPQRSPILFQIWLTSATWYCGVTEIIQMKQCGFFTHNHCFGKDFLAMNYYITALPTMIMFIVSRRLYNLIYQVLVFFLLLALIIPDQKIYARNLISFALFSAFIQLLHYSREMSERRMFMLNTQLKVAYRAQQKAQIAESKANLAKRRFASYVFHEVRVPLNTAMLAFQNMQLNMAFKEASHQNIEVYALEASLGMMQQVLNDVLDLQKMDAGHFESNPRPFPLHRAVQSVLQPVALAAAARNLNLVVDLDPRIDELQTTLSLPPTPDGSDVGAGGLWVVGDELRLRQILTNLTSNAVKFTPAGGGEIHVKSTLVEVRAVDRNKEKEKKELDGDLEKAMSEFENGNGLARSAHHQPHAPGEKEVSSGHVGGGKSYKSSPRNEDATQERVLVIRLEVKDCGPGVKPSDLIDRRLFQPFVQTKVGILSGKGSGLGLAIVKQIVSLSGGRLGVISQKGNGASFWVELSYPIASAADLYPLNVRTPPDIPLVSSPPLASPPGHLNPPIPSPSLPPHQISKEMDPSQTSTSTSIPIPQTPEGPLRVLVADDDPMTRSLMTRMLTKQGCIVETAEDGLQALNFIMKTDSNPGRGYDLISLDNFMPVMTGEQAVRELRARGRTELVVGCTGNALTEDQQSYLDAGADLVLTKPIMIKDFKSVLDIARERRRQAINP